MRPLIVFAGPSLPIAARPALADVSWRAPAVAGDGFEALAAKPRAVALIDGLFDRHPAIRHKELMALIDAGIPVVGGASMGALRAAELHTLGMIGVGRIFEAYASGRIVGDDEVAILHGPAEMDWTPLTIPQVNVRATLLAAVRARVLSPASARAVRATSAAVFFQDRTWPVVVEAARGDAPDGELDALAGWVPRGYVDQKRRDALACLDAAASLLQTGRRRAAQASTRFTDALAAQVAAGRKPTLASS